jgi:polyphosphate kinase
MQNKIPFLDRELSWLAFNYRVLQEAQDPSVPLLERITFMAIFSSNLDEYFKVRVATLKRLIKLKEKTRKKLKTDPSEQLDLLLQEVSRQQAAFGQTFRENILPELRQEQIFLLDEHGLQEEQQGFAKEYFQGQVQPRLVPVILDHGIRHVFLKDQTVYLTVRLSGPTKPNLPTERYAIIEIPTQLHGGRFVKLPTRQDQRYVMFLDDLIRLHLPVLFPDYARQEAYAIKTSRDAELDLEDEVPGDLMDKIKRSLKKRDKGYPCRLLYDPNTPADLLETLMEKTGITAEELVEGSKYHNFRDFFDFPDFNVPDLKYEPQPPLPHPGLEGKENLFAAIREQDYLVHYPYQKFDYILEWLTEAAHDTAVTTISVTLYRVGAKSKVAKALLKAVKNGKQVNVVVELKARFDEEANIYWSSKLERAGANVIHGVPDLKVHCKLGLITRTEEEGPVNYAYLSTGNYNEVTSRIYCDHALFTANPKLTREVEQVFTFLIDRQRDKAFRHLLVAPFNMREKFMDLVNQEIKHAKEGKPAYLILKLNALQDAGMIKKLYEASQAGVQIELIARGICCLVPGVEGLSENITVRSIIDRYLEHARVYIFGNGGEEKMYVASADWMTRNLNRRVEVAFPLYDPSLQAELHHILDLQRSDNTKARDFKNEYIRNGKPPVRSQYETYAFLKSMNG